MLNVGELIRKRRRAKGLTQSELAAKVGVTDGYIAKIEIGYQKPGLETAYKISQVLDSQEIADEVYYSQIRDAGEYISEKRGEYDFQFINLNPRLKPIVLELAKILEKYI